MDDEEREKIFEAIRKLNPRQQSIVLGKIAMMQAFDDDEAAIRWFERNRDSIRAEINEAG